MDLGGGVGVGLGMSTKVSQIFFTSTVIGAET